MSILNKVQKSVMMNLWEIVCFQINTYCHLNNLVISASDIDCIALLAINKESELTDFCNAACNEEERLKDTTLKLTKEIFRTPQSVRNSINKLERMNLIVKKGKSKKKICVSNILDLQAEGNIFIEIKLLRKDES